MADDKLIRADLVALRSMLVAIIATHPDKDRLRAAFDEQQQRTQATLEANPVDEEFLQEVLRRQQSLRRLVE